MTLIDYFIQGGPVMYLILFISVLGFAVFIERYMYLRNFLYCGRAILESIREAGPFQPDQAAAECDNYPGPASAIIKAGVEVSGSPSEAIDQAMESAARNQLPGINRFVHVLATVSSMATLLGLLGSVLGLMVPVNINRALISSAFGLCIAIPAIAGYNYIAAKIDLVLSEIESWTAEFIKIAARRPERSKW